MLQLNGLRPSLRPSELRPSELSLVKAFKSFGCEGFDGCAGTVCWRAKVFSNRWLFFPLWLEFFFNCYGKNKNARENSCVSLGRLVFWKAGDWLAECLSSSRMSHAHAVYIKFMFCLFLSSSPLLRKEEEESRVTCN